MTEAAEGIAVIGIGALFPGAADADRFWRNIAAGRDAIRPASARRIDPRFEDPSSSAVDRLPTRRGGFLGDEVAFDAGRFGIMPIVVPGTEPDQLLALAVAAAAVDDAGLSAADLQKSTVGVILGRGGYLTPAMVRLGRKTREAEELASILRRVVPDLAEHQVLRVKEAFQEAAGPYGPDTAIGAVPNLTASRIANRLDLRGPAYTLDAACASSLLAVEHAVRELRSGRCDVVLAGGVHLVDDLPFWSVFAQLGALSRSGAMRPFDRRADGLLIGEGIGIVVLKRLTDAERDGDRIYAAIRGVGSTSDGRAQTVMVPRSEGQVAAIARAWADAGLDPAGMGLLEAHGTATAAGDGAELETIARAFAQGEAAVLGSVKSMIGHAMPAAGAAGLIKAVLAVHHGVLPPSLHCEEPHPALAGTRFEVLGAAREWAAEQRLAGVNAFGFGGINAHVVVSSHGERRVAVAVAGADRVDVVAIAGPDPEALLALLRDGVHRGGEGPCRLALADPTPERLDRARRVVERGGSWTGRGEMWFRREGLVDAGGRVAFVFPGIEGRSAPDVTGLAGRLGVVPPDRAGPGADLQAQGREVVELGRFLNRALRSMGVIPAVYAGHSVGEWTGMLASGVVEDDVAGFLERIPFQTLEVPDVLFAAAGCDRETAERAIEGLDGIAVSHDNCPHQVLLCGHTDPVVVARERLLADGVLCQVLSFRSGFHSPLFTDYLAPHAANLAQLEVRPPHTPLWSATTLAPYPSDPDAVRALVLDHLVAPVRFRGLVEAMYADGVRVFVQVGSGAVAGFVTDTLGSRPHLAISALDDRRSDQAQIRNLLLALFVEGVPVDPPAARPRTTVPVRLGVPLVELDLPPLAVGAPEAAQDPLSRALAAATAALTEAPRDVLRALARPAPFVRTHRLSVQTVPALRDHAFFPQRPGWPIVSDWRPVVPMTMTVTLLLEAAEAARPGQIAVEAADVRALRWVVAEPPLDVTIEVHDAGGGWVTARMEDYAEARVRLATRWTEATPSLPPLRTPRRPPQTGPEMYAERWMFHGPQYQGVVDLTALDETGLDAELVALAAPGALLDAAGQLVGYWLLATHDRDPLTMPTGVARLQRFGPLPPPGTRVGCRVRVTEVKDPLVRADLELVVAGRLWCRMEGWVDHRFEADGPMVAMMRLPEHHALSEVQGDPGREWALFDDQAHRVPSRDWLARRYLTEVERDALAAIGPREQRRWLDDRVAIKDAARRLLWAEGAGPLFPAELVVAEDARSVRSPAGETLFVAVDHADHRSAAIAARQPGLQLSIEPDGRVTCTWGDR